jgi:hypothetical protein
MLDVYNHPRFSTIEARIRFVTVLATGLRAAFASITRTSRVASIHYASMLAEM